MNLLTLVHILFGMLGRLELDFWFELLDFGVVLLPRLLQSDSSLSICCALAASSRTRTVVLYLMRDIT